jgi:hypothetical protein
VENIPTEVWIGIFTGCIIGIVFLSRPKSAAQLELSMKAERAADEAADQKAREAKEAAYAKMDVREKHEADLADAAETAEMCFHGVFALTEELSIAESDSLRKPITGDYFDWSVLSILLHYRVLGIEEGGTKEPLRAIEVFELMDSLEPELQKVYAYLSVERVQQVSDIFDVYVRDALAAKATHGIAAYSSYIAASFKECMNYDNLDNFSKVNLKKTMALMDEKYPPSAEQRKLLEALNDLVD